MLVFYAKVISLPLHWGLHKNKMEKKNEIAVLEIRQEITAMDIKKFTMYSDSSHGWLQVPVRLLELLKIEQMITKYSYQSRDRKYLYLEVDLDAWTFVTAYCNIMDITAGQFTTQWNYVDSVNCFVRGLQHYQFSGK